MVLRINAIQEENGDSKITLSDYFSDSSDFLHQVSLQKKLSSPDPLDRAIFADCPPLLTNDFAKSAIYSDVLLRAATLGISFDSAMNLYGNTGNNIFVAALGGANSQVWGYRVEAMQDDSKIRFFDFLSYPFDVTVQRFQPSVINITSPRLYTSNMAEVEILSFIMQIAATSALTFTYHLTQVYGNTANPVQVREFGKINKTNGI